MLAHRGPISGPHKISSASSKSRPSSGCTDAKTFRDSAFVCTKRNCPSTTYTPPGACAMISENSAAFRRSAASDCLRSVISLTTAPKPMISSRSLRTGYQLSFQWRVIPGARAVSPMNW